jgi:hypothetical protein
MVKDIQFPETLNYSFWFNYNRLDTFSNIWLSNNGVDTAKQLINLKAPTMLADGVKFFPATDKKQMDIRFRTDFIFGDVSIFIHCRDVHDGTANRIISRGFRNFELVTHINTGAFTLFKHVTGSSYENFASDTFEIDTGVFYLIGFTFDSAAKTLTFYHNTDKVGINTTTSSSWHYNSEDIILGNRDGTTYGCPGSISDFILFDRKLDSIEVVGLYDFFSDITEVKYNPFGNKYIRSIKWTYNDTIYPFLIDVYTVATDSTGGRKNANTGLAYDDLTHRFWINTIATDTNIILRDRNMNIVGAVNSDSAAGQGITIIPGDQKLYIWRNAGIVECDYTGIPTGLVIPVNSDDGNKGSLEYDPRRNGIWTRPYEGSIYTNLHSICSTRSILSTLQTDDDEGIAVTPRWEYYFILTGQYSDKRIHQWNRLGAEVNSWLTPDHMYPDDPGGGVNGGYEGMIIDPTDNTLWYNSDQYYHGLVPGGNRLWHVNPFWTYNKFVVFPGINWSYWKGSEVSIGNYLVTCNIAGGLMISPIIDFATYSLQRDLDNIEVDADVSYSLQFRGADSTPTTDTIDLFTLDIWDANNSNNGWGSVTPSDWEDTVPDMTYIQLKITFN